MKVNVKLRLLKINEERQVELEQGSTVKSLLEKLISIYGDELKGLIGDAERGFRVMVLRNGEVIKYDKELKDQDEVSLILPVAGG